MYVVNKYSHIKHREWKLPLTKKGKYKLYLRLMVDCHSKKLYIRNAFLSEGKKEAELNIEVIKKEIFKSIKDTPIYEYRGLPK